MMWKSLTLSLGNDTLTIVYENDEAIYDLVKREAEWPQVVMACYSQRDPVWRDKVYAGGVTFGTAGCYIVAVADVLSLAGYTDEPPEVARKLREAGCFDSPEYPSYLTRPDRIPDAYPLMQYDGPVDVSKDGPLRWHDGPADMERVWAELRKGPIIAEIDFITATPKFNQHFIVLTEWDEAINDIKIADPWTGTRGYLLKRYGGPGWTFKRAIYGLRLLRMKNDG